MRERMRTRMTCAPLARAAEPYQLHPTQPVNQKAHFAELRRSLRRESYDSEEKPARTAGPLLLVQAGSRTSLKGAAR